MGLNFRFAFLSLNSVKEETTFLIRNAIMKTLGRIFGILSLVGLVIGMIPLLGWLNWLNIPFALLGLLFSILGKSKGGIILCIVAAFLGMLRLMLGGGIL